MDAGPGLMRSYRKERKISQDKLARLADVSVSAVSQIERGVHGVSRDTAERLDRALEANGELLVAFGFADPAPTPAGDMDDVHDLIAALRHAATKSDGRDDKLDQIIALCQTLVSNQWRVVDRLDANAARIEALLEHFGLEAVPASSLPE